MPPKKRHKRQIVAKPRVDRTQAFWHNLCLQFSRSKFSSANAFLRSEESGPDVSVEDARTFTRNLQKFKDGTLINQDRKRNKLSPYEDVRARLLEYIQIRERLYIRDKCGLSWALLKQKALDFAKQLGHGETFKAGDSFIQNALIAGNKKSIALHGEGMEMSLEDQQERHSSFMSLMRSTMEEHHVTLDRVYNADQTGLFFNKLPNRMYVSKDASGYRGVKQMKSKDRVTLMVATSAVGAKIPLFMVGKSKQPECFKLYPGGIHPMAYLHQTNAWFDKEVTIYWINTVLWPWHLSQHGNVHCLLLLDNCPAHTNLDESKLPMKLIIKFFPPNCTSFLQPADQGIIACLKVGYKASMLKSLLAICDDESLYQEALAAGTRARRGCKGLAYCSKAHLLDAMELMLPIWNSDSKYAKTESIQRCWRKAGLLTATEEADLENDIGRSTVPAKAKRISDVDSDELCALFSALQTKTSSFSEMPPALRGSLLCEKRCSDQELSEICATWATVEEEKDIINDDVEEAMEELELLMNDSLLPSFDNFDPDEYNDGAPDSTMDCEYKYTWNECLASCDVIKQFLEQKQMASELLAFDSFQHKLRLKRISTVTSQLSIKSFFKKK
jgi:hypothetical protein